MSHFQRILAAAAFVFICALPGVASAQLYGVTKVVGTCGVATYSAGTMQYPTQSTTGAACVDVSGSSGGGTAVFGPTAAGSAAANPPVIIGGTNDGTASGTVRNATVTDAGHLVTDSTIVGGTVTLSGGLTPVPVTSTNVSTTVTLGGTFQSLMALNSSRKTCLIQNPITATETLYVFFGTTGSATLSNSYAVAPGAAIGCTAGTSVLTDNVAVSAATTSHVIIASYAQ